MPDIDESLLKTVKLDKSQDHAIVFPPENGAHFHQNGFYFDHHGNLAPNMLAPESIEALKKADLRKKADAAAEVARKKFLEESGLDESDLEGDDALTKVIQIATAAADDVDLVAWAKGQKQYVFGVIRKAVSEQYSYQGSTKEAILNWMVENGKVAEEDVKR